MMRGAFAVIAGLIVWAILATGLDMLLRVALVGYRAAEPSLQFTLGMMIARLALPGAVPSVGAGFVSAWIGRGNRLVITILIIILLVVFLPTHFQLRLKFPLWYHLTFLLSLILLPLLGAKLRALLAKS